MNPNNLNEEQIADIKAREAKCIEFLKENDMGIAAVVGKVKIDSVEGKEIFADLVQPYLADTKYANKSAVNEDAQPTETA